MALPHDVIERHDAIVVALTGFISDEHVGPIGALDDRALLELARLAARQQQLATTNAAVIAGEIARRSANVLGSAGLAQRLGHRTPAELVRVTTGSTKREATAAVSVGLLVTDAPTWLAPIAAAISARTLSGASAQAIRNGLGEPSSDVSPDALLDAAHRLCALAPSVDSDRLYSLARELRDEIDEAGVVDRERARYDARALRFRRLPDGMARLDWLLDPESAALIGELFDRTTSPRRGGPRFVNPDDRAVADHMLGDRRSTEQYASDVFVELLRQGADADSTQLLGSGAPALRVLVTAPALNSRSGHGTASARGAGFGHGAGSGHGAGPGHGVVEGSPASASLATVDRIACGATVTEVAVDSTGQVLDLGREHRLYSRRQRVALAVRDGGCRWPDCERPPSWCEAHHTRQWSRDHGATNVDDGILLCRHHHLLSHNNGWEITHERGSYLLTPPPDIDPDQTRIPMPSKTSFVRQLARAGGETPDPLYESESGNEEELFRRSDGRGNVQRDGRAVLPEALE